MKCGTKEAAIHFLNGKQVRRTVWKDEGTLYLTADGVKSDNLNITHMTPNDFIGTSYMTPLQVLERGTANHIDKLWEVFI